MVKAMVAEMPEAGRANRALVKLVAKAWQVPKSDITIVAGTTDRNKTLHIAGDPAALSDRLMKQLHKGGGDNA